MPLSLFLNFYFFSQYLLSLFVLSVSLMISLFFIMTFQFCKPKWAKIVLSIFMLAPLSMTFYFQPKPKEIPVIPKQEIHQISNWLKKHPSFTSNVLLAHPNYGDWISYAQGIKTVANCKLANTNHNIGRKKWAVFSLSQKEEKRAKYFYKNNIKHILVSSQPDYKKAQAILGINLTRKKIEKSTLAMLGHFSQKRKGTNTVFLPQSSYFRVIYADNPEIQKAKFKLFEIVKGATIIGRTHPEAYVRVFIPLEIEIDGKIQRLMYHREIKANYSGEYKCVVPYCSDKPMGQIRATKKMYELTSAGVTTTIVVPEQAIKKGAIIRVRNLTRNW